MTVNEITAVLESLAPLPLAEDFDNAGLLLGRPDMEVTGVLVTLDTLENVIEEAIAKNCNLIISFHPIIFKGLKKITGTDYVERVVLKAIEHKIAIYSPHTALDNVQAGVNGKLCEVLGIKNPSILIPRKGCIKKLVTYIPRAHTETVLKALFEAGAGSIGNYDLCSFTQEGRGSFRAGENANPVLGKKGELHFEPENQVHLTFPEFREASVLQALRDAHPYEEIAYEVTTLENSYQNHGMGMVGELEQAISTEVFLEKLKEKTGTGCIRHSAVCKAAIKRVAVLGGSGAFAIGAVRRAGADIFITGDVKYHQFYEAENELIIADIGHYETEQFTKNLLVDYLKEKIPNFAVSLSESITNPINYF